MFDLSGEILVEKLDKPVHDFFIFIFELTLVLIIWQNNLLIYHLLFIYLFIILLNFFSTQRIFSLEHALFSSFFLSLLADSVLAFY